MRPFAELLDALVFTPSRLGKLRLMRRYFETTRDPDRGWALAALTGSLSFREAKPALIRGLTQRRISRRDALRYAGIGAGAIGLAALLDACGVGSSSAAGSASAGAFDWSQQTLHHLAQRLAP